MRAESDLWMVTLEKRVPESPFHQALHHCTTLTMKETAGMGQSKEAGQFYIDLIRVLLLDIRKNSFN